MKTIHHQISYLALGAILFFSFISANAQDTLKSSEITNTIKLEKAIEAIEAGGALRIFLSQGDDPKVVADYPGYVNMQNLVEVNDNTLSFNLKGIQKQDKLKIYVTVKNLNRIESSGASNIKGIAPLKSDHFTLEASGASKVELDLSCNNLIVESSGASDVKLAGKSELVNLEATGASNVKAMEMEISKASVEISGASKVSMNVKDEISGETSGAAKLSLKQMPAKPNLETSGASKIYIGDKITVFGSDQPKNAGDEPQMIKLNDIKTITIDDNGIIIKSDSGSSEPLIINDDGVKIMLNEKQVDGKTQGRVLVINDDGVKVVEKDLGENHNWHWPKKNKFNGHWGGFELGVNGYLNKEGTTTMPADFQYLDLRMEKSINLKINFFEQNINLIRNHFGLVTGLGLEYANYRFKNNVVLVQDSFNLYGSYGTDVTKSYEKSKLVVNYLDLPLFFEYQTNAKDHANSFHVGAGMILGWRIGSHAKNIINGAKVKQKDAFSMDAFKYDLTARIGWGMLNVNATYALTSLFKKDRGPELYPFSLGLTLVNF
ncbi:MAG: DUF2807 domain-containing protein [Bacteroidota bacterium]